MFLWPFVRPAIKSIRRNTHDHKRSTREKKVPGKQKKLCQKGNQKETEMNLVIYCVKNFDGDMNYTH